ncbi:type III-B CRISPR module-associated protein Cmr5 [Aeribacillus sp. FSL k6-2211]|uniref:type III-B CRISPR module-associated protein Cmr5 n=1 Tax=Aeribacillus sp. FSL k6-2211 TaxID=2954608 RepID=UPI0030CC2CB5
MAVERVGIENGRASFAFESVKKAFQDNKVNFESYRSYVKKMPSLIQVNGLGQALAFCYQKKKEYRVIYDQLHTWLRGQYKQYFQEQNKEFVEVVIGLKSSDYRVLTMEVLALF